ADQLKAKLKDPSALMVEIIGRLQHLDQAARIRITDELFGGTGGEQFLHLLDQGAAGIQRTIIEANRLGLVMDQELIGKAQELDRKFSELTARLDTFFKRSIVGAVETGEAWAKLREEQGGMVWLLEQLIPGGRNAGEVIAMIFGEAEVAADGTAEAIE